MVENEAKGQKRERDGERKREGERRKRRALESRGKGVIEPSLRTISCGIIFLIGVVGEKERFIDSVPNGLWEIRQGEKCKQIHRDN